MHYEIDCDVFTKVSMEWIRHQVYVIMFPETYIWYVQQFSVYIRFYIEETIQFSISWKSRDYICGL